MDDNIETRSADQQSLFKVPLTVADSKANDARGESSADNNQTDGQRDNQSNIVLPEALTQTSPPVDHYFLEQLKVGILVDRKSVTKSRLVFGRARDCDVVLEHPSISRYHAVLLWTPADELDFQTGKNRDSFWYLVDCGSTHGTVCNKELLSAGKMYKLIANNNVFKFGGSTRLFTLSSPNVDQTEDVDEEVETETVEQKPSDSELKSAVDRGCGWGIDYAEAEGEHEETADSKALQAIIAAMKDGSDNKTANDNAYSANPNKCIQQWFEREGYDMDYKVDSIHNKFKCTFELPIDGQWIPVEGSLTPKKKDAITDACLKCCQLLDRAELLFPWQQQSSRSKRRRLGGDSDSDSGGDMIDETEENKIKKKMKDSKSAESYESLKDKWNDISQELKELKARLVSMEDKLKNKKDNVNMIEGNDSLDNYMANIGKEKFGLCMNDKIEKSRIKMRIKLLEKEQLNVEKLMNLAKPALVVEPTSDRVVDNGINIKAESKSIKAETSSVKPITASVKPTITLKTIEKRDCLQLKYKRLSPNASPLTRGSPKAAGYDLCSAYDYTIPAKGKEMVKTDIAVAIPDGHYGRIAPRSGLTWKNFIDVGAGVVDQDYRGNVCVILINFSDNEFPIKRGDRIAQLICEKIAITEPIETDSLDDTQRGSSGFGSTGVASSL